MKKEYINPDIEIVTLSEDEVIATSGESEKCTFQDFVNGTCEEVNE